jgi:hypothetical protein
VLCLKSRIVNMLSPGLFRRDKIARTQAEASITIVRRFISDALNDPDGWDEAKESLATIFRYVRSDQYVKEQMSSLELIRFRSSARSKTTHG